VPTTHHHYERDGIRLHYELETAPGQPHDAPLALILPGFWRRAASPAFAPLSAALLARGLRVLRFENRGHGGSEGVYSFGHHESDDVAALLRELAARGDKVVAVWGLSMGGSTSVLALDALRETGDWPEALREWVLISSPVGRPRVRLHWFSPATFKQLSVGEAAKAPRFKLRHFPAREQVARAAARAGAEALRRGVRLRAFHCETDWLIDVKLGRALYEALGPGCTPHYIADPRRLHADALMRAHLSEMMKDEV
jgi:pimeloyl-ACP methyl ester carboxylesterase